ncbi:MAG: hypothetical protein Kow0063_16780 [Anaerolineae bacterium]
MVSRITAPKIFLHIFQLLALWLAMLTTPVALASGATLYAEKSQGQIPSSDQGTVYQLPNPGNHQDIQPYLQAAVDSASNGDTIVLPAGEFYIDKRVFIDKFISIKGQGSGEGGTKLYRREDLPDETLENWAYRDMFNFKCNSDTPSHIVVSDIYFKGKTPSVVLGDGGSEAYDSAITVRKCVDFVITNNRFEHFGYSAVVVSHRDSRAAGLIFNNIFVDNFKMNSREPRGTTTGYGVVVSGDNKAWADNPNFGTDNFIFVEDNYFVGHRHAIAGGGGGLYVFRYNEVANNLAGQAVDAHGVAYSNIISTRAYEVYGNFIYNTVYRDGITPLTDSPPTSNFCDDLAYTGMTLRGGEGLIYDNTIEGYRYGIRIITENTLYDNSSGVYPEYCQIGYKSGESLGDNHSGIYLPESDGDMFIWNNRFTYYPDEKTQGCHMSDVVNHAEVLLHEGRDFHLNTSKPDYQPYVYPHPLRALYEPLTNPTPTVTPTPTDTPVPTSTPTLLPTDTPAPTSTATPSPTMTPTPTSTPWPTDTPVPTGTPAPPPTDTPVPTNTSVPSPTSTLTPTVVPTPIYSPTVPGVTQGGSHIFLPLVVKESVP